MLFDMLQIKGKYYYSKNHYVAISPKLLVKIDLLLKKMNERSLNTNALDITSAFRTVRYNRQINGASRSRHLYGEAVDIMVGDVNNDGQTDQKYKEEIVKIISALDEKHTEYIGGLGYHYSTKMLIHMDVRGIMARW